MGAGTIYAKDLDGFVAECDRLGGLGGPEIPGFFADFEYRPAVAVDQGLDPFCDGYFRGQCELYFELSGRELNQQDGELTPLDVDAHTAGCNPYNNPDIAFISKHARAVHTALMMANLKPGASILDAGCGWGLTTEAMAFCGAAVTAVDINPRFVELVRRRAERLALRVETVHSNFDTFETDRRFDLLFFYECLHHALKPWETLACLGRFVKPEGKIAFAGEPVNGIWWKHWGLRLDPYSLFCARKFGWWESGWTMEFIAGCFARAGFALTAYDDVGLDNGAVGIAIREPAAEGVSVNDSVLEPARRREREFAALEAQLRVQIAGLHQSMADLKRSRSWRVTAPLRAATRWLGRRA